MTSPRLVLITGAAGFVGRHLIDALRDDRPLRCLVRPDEDLDAGAGVEVVTGDLADRDGLAALLDGIDCAYYLVHSMEAGGDDDLAARDRELAINMADAARTAGVRRLVYMGGIDPQGADFEHLDSRHEVEEILSGFGGELVTLRAAMIVGRGSASFDTLPTAAWRAPSRALVTDQDRELLTPLMAGLDADLVIEGNALLPVFGITPMPFADAACAALAGARE